MYQEQNLFIAELCKGSTADSDSVCLGSNPSSAAIRKDHPRMGGLFLRRRTAASNAVPQALRSGAGFAYPRAERVELARKRQAVGIFAKGEYPSSAFYFFTFHSSLFTKTSCRFLASNWQVISNSE